MVEVNGLSQILTRENGSQVKLVGRMTGGLFCEATPDVWALFRQDENSDWRLLSKEPHPDWKTMSVDDYVKRGRSEFLQNVSFGERVRFRQMFYVPINELDLTKVALLQ